MKKSKKDVRVMKLHTEYIESTYEELTELGTGGKGTTFLAKHRGSGKIVVKKRVPLQMQGIYERIKRIEHPNVAKVYEVCACADCCIIIEEYISGETLEAMIEKYEILPIDTVKRYYTQVLRGILEIHKQQIVHRDLTPANIIISTDNVAKIIDFGIARNPKQNQGKDTVVLGTVGYASPEQFGFRQTDERTDIYALGILLNKMLTGHFPNEQLTGKHKFKAIVEKCTQFEPEKRYLSAEEILKEIEDEKQEQSIWPGFRTGDRWRKILACAGYVLLLMGIFISLADYGTTPKTFMLEVVALFLYVLMPFMIATNFGRWDRKLKPFSAMPKEITVTIRIVGSLIFFYFGIQLENYIKYVLLHLPKT